MASIEPTEPTYHSKEEYPVQYKITATLKQKVIDLKNLFYSKSEIDDLLSSTTESVYSKDEINSLLSSTHKFTCIYNGVKAKAYANNYYVFIQLVETTHSISTSWSSIWSSTLDSKYRPLTNIYFKASEHTSDGLYWGKISTDGKVYLRGTNSATITLYGGVMYPRKDMLP